MVDTVSALLEFKLVGNYHRIVNLGSTFSVDDMVKGAKLNQWQFIPVSTCSDNWKSNIKSDYTLNKSVAVPLRYIEDENSTPIECTPNEIELIANDVGYGGLTVSVGTDTPVVQIGSVTQSLKGVFVVNKNTQAVLCYCILPEPVPVRNYLQIMYEGYIVEIEPKVYGSG